MIDIYLVNKSDDLEKLVEDLDKFYSTLEMFAEELGGLSTLTLDAATLLSRLTYLKKNPVHTEKRTQWEEKHPGYIHQSYDQLSRWTLIDNPRIKRAFRFLEDKGIILDRNQDSCLYLKFELPNNNPEQKFIFENHSNYFWKDGKLVNTMLSIQYLLGGDKVSRDALKLFMYLTKLEGNKFPKTIEIQRDINLKRAATLAAIERLEKEKFINKVDKSFTINYDYITDQAIEGRDFGYFIGSINSKREHNAARLRNNKLRMLRPQVEEQLKDWKKLYPKRFEEDETLEEEIFREFLEELYSRLYGEKHGYLINRDNTDNLRKEQDGYFYFYFGDKMYKIASSEIYKKINFDTLTKKKIKTTNYHISTSKYRKYRVESVVRV